MTCGLPPLRAPAQGPPPARAVQRSARPPETAARPHCMRISVIASARALFAESAYRTLRLDERFGQTAARVQQRDQRRRRALDDLASPRRRSHRATPRGCCANSLRSSASAATSPGLRHVGIDPEQDVGEIVPMPLGDGGMPRPGGSKTCVRELPHELVQVIAAFRAASDE